MRSSAEAMTFFAAASARAGEGASRFAAELPSKLPVA